MNTKSGKTTARECKPISLALQGGGAHGAFTWGVIDQLLTDPSIDVEAISATSAGAVNAVVAAYGVITGGPEKARELLQQFWRKVSIAASMSPLQPTIFDRLMGQNNLAFSPTFMAMDAMTRMFSPYQLNLFDLNPLRSIVEELVDFDVIRANKKIKLFVNATHVRTGKPKIFKTGELTLDMVMASCCLPVIFKTVYVDGEPYWDGGYSGNPAIFPLIYNAPTRDVVLVQINPLNMEEVPTRAAEIMDRINEISFNAPLMAEMRAINFVGRLIEEGKLSDRHYKKMHIHLIEAEAIMTGLDSASKMNADWEFLSHLRATGMQAAEDWSRKHHSALGKHSSINIKNIFL